MNLTIQDLLTIEHHSEFGVEAISPGKTFRDVSTDSRTTRQGDLFVALRGERFDGHDFVESVSKEGAIAAIVDRVWLKKHERARKALKVPLLVVEDTLEAFGSLASLYRKKFDIPVLVIAGSNGKTTTKELIAQVLGSTFEVLRTEKNYNNQVGLPRMIFKLRDGHEMAVLEIGTNHPGEIERLAAIAQPTHALITNIGREHLEFFKNMTGVAKEELKAFDYVREHGGFAFINEDDPVLETSIASFGDRAVTYGENTKSGVASHRMGRAKDGRLELRITAEAKSFRLRTGLIADYAPNLIAAAAAVGLHFRLRRAEIKQAIEHFKPHDKRLEVVQLTSGVTILNDSYNANPDSMESAFKTLARFPATGKRYAVLGDMFELGAAAPKEHREIGKKAAQSKFQHVFFTGEEMVHAYKSFLKEAGDPKRASLVPKKDDIAEALRRMLKPGDTILVKGSRGMKMEDVIELLQR